MSRLFFILLSFLLVTTFALGYSCAGGYGFGKAKIYPEQEQGKRNLCCAEETPAYDCCGKPLKKGCNDPDCSGKCCGQCGCQAGQVGATITPVTDFFLSLSKRRRTDHFYISSFQSRISLDIWLPPDNRRV